MTDAARTGTQACAWLVGQVKSPSKNWHGLCLQLQRTARAIPAVYPSALAAQHATPKTERVLHYSDLTRGMVAYFDDPDDSNPYGHIVTVAGWDGPKSDLDNLLVYSNDVVAGREGAVGLVPGTFFAKHWGDRFVFGATWLNGYNFADLDQPATPTTGRVELADNLDHAIADLEKAIRAQRRLGRSAVVNALWEDLAHLRVTRQKLIS